jgi:hypothetical protein
MKIRSISLTAALFCLVARGSVPVRWNKTIVQFPPTTLGIVDIVAVAKCYVLPLHFVFLLQSRLGGCPHGPEGADWFAAEALPRGSSGVRGDGGGAPCIGSMAFEMLGELAGCPVTSSRVLTCTSLGTGTCIVAH